MSGLILENRIDDIKNNKILLYGASSGGRNCLNYLGKIGCGENVVAFIDGDVSKQGSEMHGIPILPPEKLKQSKDCILIIASGYYQAIMNRVSSIGFDAPIYAFYSPEPQYGGEEFIADDIFIKNYYLESDACTKEMIDLVVSCRKEPLLCVQPISEFLRFSASAAYWYESATSLTTYENLTFCDAGAYDGDTMRELTDDYGERVKKYHAFEPDTALFQKMLNCIKTLPFPDRCKVYPFGLGNKKESLRFESDSMTSHISHEGSNVIDVVTLDSQNIEVDGELCIKMDIEGFELEALEGARETIAKYKPKLAICVYHKANDIFKIPQFIQSIHPSYECILRGGTHMVCYAK